MPTVVAMPSLGMTMREGIVVEWRARVGERVARGAPLLVIESEKAEVEIEAPADGVVRAIFVAPGATVPCGTPLALLTERPDEPFDADAFARPAPSRAAAAPTAAAGPVRAEAAHAAAAPPVTPAARRLAKERGVDLAKVRGSGPGGRVTREDVEFVAARLASRIMVREGFALACETAGEGDLVLLLPGFGTDATAFARVIPALAARRRVLALHPRGVGLSDAPPAEIDRVEDFAEDAAAAAGGPAHVVGASLGAAAALELALHRPERVRSLALLTPFLRADGRLLAVVDAWIALAERGTPELLAQAIVPWLYSPAFLEDPGRRARAVAGLADSASRVPAAALRRAAAGLREWRLGPERLARLEVPILIIAGETDPLTPDSAALARLLPRARRVVLPGVSHGLMLETPDAVARELLAHLDSIG